MSEPLQEWDPLMPKKPPTRDEWNRQKKIIRSLYIEQNKRLKEVVSIMSDYYGFEATPRMYKKRLAEWKFCKYTSGKVYADCAAKLKDNDGKSHIMPDPRLGTSGPVPLRQVKRYMKRKEIADRQRSKLCKRKARAQRAGQLEGSSQLQRFSSNTFGTPTGQPPDLDYSASPTDSINSLSQSSTYFTDNVSLDRATNAEALANEDLGLFALIGGLDLCGSTEDQIFMEGVEFVGRSWVYMSAGCNLAGLPPPVNPDLHWIHSFAYISDGCHGQSDGFDTNMLTPTRPISPGTAYEGGVSQINHGGDNDVDIVKPQEADLTRCCSEQISDTVRWIKICILVARFEAFGMPDLASMGMQILSQLFKQMAANKDRNMLVAILCAAVALYSYDLQPASRLLYHACRICKDHFGPGHPITASVEFMVGIAAEEKRGTGGMSSSHVERMTRLFEEFLPDHPYSLVSLYNIAVVSERNQQPNEAIQTLRDLEMLCAQYLPGNHPLGIMCRMTLARLLADQKKVEEAVSFMTVAIDQCKDTWRPTHPYTLECVRRRTDLYKTLGKSHKVEYGFNYVLQGRKKSLGCKHRLTLGSYEQWENSRYGPESLRMQMCY